ncbi:MAG: MBL fold metallo-hydrolase [Acidimicrobiia bacterium]
MRVTFHGVRGSTPVFGDEYVRTGGHTSCVAVGHDDDLPVLVLDAGTGLQALARRFAGRPFVGVVLLTHLHWDHVHGLPFFPPADRAGADVTLVQPAQGDPVEVLSGAMSPPHFPITPRELGGTWRHVALEPGAYEFAGFAVTAAEVQHKGGRTFGYRIEHGGMAMAYVPDALDASDDAIVELSHGVDLLVRGAPFTATESGRAVAYGHGTIEHAIATAKRAGVGRLVITHHGVYRSDEDLEALSRTLGAEFARESMAIDVGRPD